MKPLHALLEMSLPRQNRAQVILPRDKLMATLIMVRTQCCEAYKQFGQRCEICPNRPENREAVLRYKRESVAGLGCNVARPVTCGGTATTRAIIAQCAETTTF